MERTARKQTAGGGAIVVAVWLALVATIAGAALPRLGELGMYYDEAFLAQQARDFVVPERAGPHPGSVRSIALFGRPFPLRNAAYLGSLKSQLLIPALAIAGSSPETVRATTLATGLLALLLSMLWAGRVFGLPTALVGGLLVASDPSFYFLSQFEWGPFTTNLLCRSGGLLLLTVAWQSPHRRRSLAAATAGGALLGLGVFSRADFALVPVACGLALAITRPDLVRDALRKRRALVAAGGGALLLAASPMLLSALQLVGASAAVAERGGVADKARVLWSVLDGSHFYRLMEVGGVFERIFEVDAPWSPFGWLLLLCAVGLGTALGARSRRHTGPGDRGARAFLLATSVILTGGMLLMPGAVRAHHQLNSMPFLQLVVASVLVDIGRRSWPSPTATLAARGAAGLALAAVLVGNVAVIAQTRRLIADTGGRGRWSQELNRFAEAVDAEPGSVVVSLDWGFHEPLLFLTDHAKLVEPIWAIPGLLRSGRPWIFEGDGRTVYLAHGEPYDLFGLGPLFLDFAHRLGPSTARIGEHRDRQGGVAFYSVRIPRRHRLIYTGRFRLD